MQTAQLPHGGFCKMQTLSGIVEKQPACQGGLSVCCFLRISADSIDNTTHFLLKLLPYNETNRSCSSPSSDRERQRWSLIPQQMLLAPGDESAGSVGSAPTRVELCGVGPELRSGLPCAATFLIEATGEPRSVHLRPGPPGSV